MPVWAVSDCVSGVRVKGRFRCCCCCCSLLLCPVSPPLSCASLCCQGRPLSSVALPRVLRFRLDHNCHPLALLFGWKATIRIIVHLQLSLLLLSAPAFSILWSQPFFCRSRSRSRSRSHTTLQLCVPRDVLEREHHVFDLAPQSV